MNSCPKQKHIQISKGDTDLIKMETDYEKLKEKHKDVLENKAVRAIANWYNNPPRLSEETPISEEEYVERAKTNIKGLKQKLKYCLN